MYKNAQDGAGSVKHVASRDLFIDRVAGHTRVFRLYKSGELIKCAIYSMLARHRHKGLIDETERGQVQWHVKLWAQLFLLNSMINNQNSVSNIQRTMKLFKENKKERLYTEVKDGIITFR